MARLVKLVIPLALAIAVVISAATAPSNRPPVKPEPQRSLSLQR